MDLSQISTEDLMKAAGQSQGPDLSSMSTEDLMKAAKSGTGVANNFASGFNNVAAETLGLPGNVVNAIEYPAHIAATYARKGVNSLIGNPQQTPEEEAARFDASRLHIAPQDIKSGMEDVGIGDPRNAVAVTGPEKFARGAGTGVGDALSMAIPAGVVSKAAPAGSLTKSVAETLAAQPITQAVSTGVGEGTTEATDSPLAGLVTSLLTAGGMSGAKSFIDNAGAKKAFIDAAPTTDALKSQAQSAYKAADDAGLVVSSTSFGNAVSDIENAAVKAGIDKDIHPKASAVLRRLSDEASTPKTLQDLDIMRRVAKSAAGSIEPDERRIGSIIVDKLDDYVGGLKPTDVLAGDPVAANSALTSARQSWSQMRKSDLIEGIIEKAQNQASGNENGLRIGFRQLLNNKKALRGFSDDEIAAIKDVAQGTVTNNTLRRLGKLGFGSKAQTNFLGGSIGAVAGHAAGGPIGAVAVPAMGYAAQKASEALTSRAAQYARALSASGGQAPVSPQSFGQMFLGNQKTGPNASLMAKVLMDQNHLPLPDSLSVQR